LEDITVTKSREVNKFPLLLTWTQSFVCRLSHQAVWPISYGLHVISALPVFDRVLNLLRSLQISPVCLQLHLKHTSRRYLPFWLHPNDTTAVH
jgi:hypothetical protein